MKTSPKQPDRQAHTAGPSAMAMKCAEKIGTAGLYDAQHDSNDTIEAATIIDSEYGEVVEALTNLLAACNYLEAPDTESAERFNEALVESQAALRSAIQGVKE